MKHVTTLFLKLAVIFIGIPVLALCIFLVPHMSNFAAKLYPNIAPMKYLVFIVMYGAAVPFTKATKTLNKNRQQIYLTNGSG